MKRKEGTIMNNKVKWHRIAVLFLCVCLLYLCGGTENTVLGAGRKQFSNKTPIIKYVKYSEDGIKIKWEKVQNADGYNIYRKDGEGNWEFYDTVENGKKYVDAYAETGIEYQYSIEGYTYQYGKMVKTKRSKGSKTVKGIPAKVQQVDARYKSNNYVLLTWNENVEASGYYIYKSTGKAWKLIFTIEDPSVCKYKDYDIKKGEINSYKVIPYEIIENETHKGYFNVKKAIAYSATVIDVSHHNGKITWSDVKADGIDFAFIRAGYGDPDIKSGGVVDKRFARNMKYATKNGINVGVYLYSYADSVKDAKKEAKFLIKLLKEYKEFDGPVVYDFENEYRKKYKYKNSNTKIISAFCKEIKNAGYETMVYSDNNMFTKYVKYDKIKKYGIWVAYWTYDTKRYPVTLDNVLIWQYSDKGIIDGIDERTDRNVKFFY